MQSPKPMGVNEHADCDVGDSERNSRRTVEVEMRAASSEEARMALKQAVDAVTERNDREPNAEQPHLNATAGRSVSQVLSVIEHRAMLFVCPKAHTYSAA